MNDEPAGGSARAEYERRLAHHKAEQRRRRPTLLIVGAAFAIVGLLRVGSDPGLGWLFVLVGVAIPIAALFTTPQSIQAWATGAEGEARTGRFLEPLEAEGFRVLHDRKIPGSRANIDHIVIGPPGIFVVETKSYTGSLRIRGGEVYVAGRRKTGMIEEATREALAVQIALADEIDAHGYHVTPIICVHRADLPWFGSEVGGVRIVSGKDLVKRLRKADVVLSPDDVDRLAGLTAARLKPATPPPSKPT
jgi:Nuclease-related domain